jgi:hypothetical protein
MKKFWMLFLAAGLVFLTACGGGGGNSTPPKDNAVDKYVGVWQTGCFQEGTATVAPISPATVTTVINVYSKVDYKFDKTSSDSMNWTYVQKRFVDTACANEIVGRAASASDNLTYVGDLSTPSGEVEKYKGADSNKARKIIYQITGDSMRLAYREGGDFATDLDRGLVIYRSK